MLQNCGDIMPLACGTFKNPRYFYGILQPKVVASVTIATDDLYECQLQKRSYNLTEILHIYGVILQRTVYVYPFHVHLL